MSYGARIDSEGKDFRSDGQMPVQTGEKVVGCTIKSIGIASDKEGNTIPGRAVVEFLQPGGAIFRQMYFDNEAAWAIDKTNQQILHIATKVVPADEYFAVTAGATGFDDFFKKVGGLLIPKSVGKTFTLKIALREKDGSYFPTFPNYPNFIELDGTTPSTLKTDPKYDYYVAPSTTTAEEALDSKGSDADVF
jgi:hypothetical protein